MLNICTLNIRCDKKTDGIHQWFFRRCKLIRKLKKYNADVIVLQEVNSSQLDYIAKKLKKQYKYYCPDVSANGGLYQPIFYKEGIIFNHGDYIWLNKYKEPNKTSWDEKYPRLLSFIDLINIGDKYERYIVCNVHLDHLGVIAGPNQAKIAFNEIKKYCKDNKCNNSKIVFIGDFNAQKDSNVWKIFNDNFYGEEQSDITFYEDFNVNVGRKIDFIFCSTNEKKKEYTDIQKTLFPYSDHTIIGCYY